MQQRRTCRSLGDFINDAFEPNFTALGLTTREIKFSDYDRNEPENLPPPLANWLLTGSNKEKRANALAHGVDILLRNRTQWPLPSKNVEATRLPRGKDVAILCRMTDQVEHVARALSRRGLKCAVERRGLMASMEVEFVVAALRLTSDSTDTLAAAELVRFCAPEAIWLDAAFHERPLEALAAQIPFFAALEAIRSRMLLLTPAETLDAVIHAPGLLDIVRSWGEPEDRIDRLEALRQRARTYEDEQRSARSPATLGGLCVWFAEATDAKQPLSRDPEAINVLTYHGAKGLEWPIVILTELDSKLKADPFGLAAEKEGAVDWRAPLAGRWIRYWPWPYGAQEVGVWLDVTAPASPTGQAVQRAETAERTRLLYVGATRARDYLILATTAQEQSWLAELKDAEGPRAVELMPGAILACGKSHPSRSATFDEGLDNIIEAPSRHLFGPALMRDAVVRLPLVLTPSASRAPQQASIRETVPLGARIILLGEPDMQRVGEACHRFIAADLEGITLDRRLAIAEGILHRWSVPSPSYSALRRLVGTLIAGRG